MFAADHFLRVNLVLVASVDDVTSFLSLNDVHPGQIVGTAVHAFTTTRGTRILRAFLSKV